MKIVVIGPQFTDSFARNISVTFRNMGHEVVDIDGMRGTHNRSRFANGIAKLFEKAIPDVEHSRYSNLVKRVEDAAPDFVLVTIGILPPEIVDRIKAAAPKAQVACWYTDCNANLPRYYLLACNYDAFFLKEPSLIRAFRDLLGLNAYYLPEACNPLWHRKTEISEAEHREFACDICGAGTLHYYRARMLEPFSGRDMKIWGKTAPAWLNSSTRKHFMGRYVTERTKAVAYSSAKVLVNTISFQEFEGVNCTLFEAAGCGAFQIAEWKPTLPEHFIPEQEIVTYRSRKELIEKVDYYLDHPAEREAIAARAYSRAHRDHTYERRLTTMLQVLGLTDQKITAKAF